MGRNVLSVIHSTSATPWHLSWEFFSPLKALLITKVKPPQDVMSHAIRRIYYMNVRGLLAPTGCHSNREEGALINEPIAERGQPPAQWFVHKFIESVILITRSL